MKIIYLHQYFNTPNTHGSTRSFELAIRLVRDGHDVHMITSQQDNKKNKNLKMANSGVDGMSIKGHINSFKFWFNKIKNLKPKYFIYLLGINDRYLIEKYAFRDHVDNLEESTGNIYESIVMLSKRSNQINVEIEKKRKKRESKISTPKGIK